MARAPGREWAKVTDLGPVQWRKFSPVTGDGYLEFKVYTSHNIFQQSDVSGGHRQRTPLMSNILGRYTEGTNAMCPGCVLRRSGGCWNLDRLFPNGLPEGYMPPSKCTRCISARIELDGFAKKFFEGLETEPSRIVQTFKAVPPWRKYCLVGQPNSAVRVIALKHVLASEVIDFFATPKQQLSHSEYDLGKWVVKFQLLVMNCLPEFMLRLHCIDPETHQKSTLASIVLEYADPSTFWVTALQLDENFKPGQKTEGLIVLPNLPPRALTLVAGWTNSVVQILEKMPPNLAFLFVAPLGYLRFKEILQKLFDDSPLTYSTCPLTP
jgi:hypothetical protein